MRKIEGKIEGQAEGKAEALLIVLAARGIVIDEVTRTRLLGQHDVDQLDRWIARATTCQSLADLDIEPRDT